MGQTGAQSHAHSHPACKVTAPACCLPHLHAQLCCAWGCFELRRHRGPLMSWAAAPAQGSCLFFASAVLLGNWEKTRRFLFFCLGPAPSWLPAVGSSPTEQLCHLFHTPLGQSLLPKGAVAGMVFVSFSLMCSLGSVAHLGWPPGPPQRQKVGCIHLASALHLQLARPS